METKLTYVYVHIRGGTGGPAGGPVLAGALLQTCDYNKYSTIASYKLMVCNNIYERVHLSQHDDNILYCLQDIAKIMRLHLLQ